MSLGTKLRNDRVASVDSKSVDGYGYEAILPSSHQSHPSSAKSMRQSHPSCAKSRRRRMSVGTKLPNNHVASVDSNAVDRYGYETILPSSHQSHPSSAKSMRRRMSLGSKSVVDGSFSPTPATPRLGDDGLRSTIHGDSTSALNRPEFNRTFTGTAISMKKKTKGFGKNLMRKLRSIDNADGSPGNFRYESDENSQSSCFKGNDTEKSHHSRSSGKYDHEDDDEQSFFSTSSSKSKPKKNKSTRSCDPEMLSPRFANSPRSAKRGGKKKVSSRVFRSADDNFSVGSNKTSKSRSPKSSRKGVKVVDDLSEVKQKRRGRNKYKSQSSPPDDMSQQSEEQAMVYLRRSQELQKGSHHSKSSKSESITSKKASIKMERKGSIKKGMKNQDLQKGSHHSRSSRSESVTSKKSSKHMERRASIQAMKKMDCMLGQLEKYENNLETEQMALRKQVEAMALEKEYAEQRNHELELQLEEMKEKAEMDAGLLVSAESNKNQSAEEIDQLKIENDILKRRLQRHEVSLLKINTGRSMRDLGASMKLQKKVEESPKESKEVAQKDKEIIRLQTDACLLRDKVRDKTDDYEQQFVELEQAKDELAKLKYSIEHTGSFKYHNMNQIIKGQQSRAMQPADVALSDFFDAY